MAQALWLAAQAVATGAGAYLLLPAAADARAYPAAPAGPRDYLARTVAWINHAQDVPLLERLAAHPLLAPTVEELRTLLWKKAGLALSRPGAVAAIGTGVVFAGLCGWWFGSSLGGFVAASGAALAWLWFHASQLEQRKARQLADEMPGIFRSLSASLAAGRSLAQSIDHVAIHEEGPAAEAFSKAAMRLRCSYSISEVLGMLEGDLEAPGVGLLVNALSISQRNGSPLGGILEQAAELVERQGEFEQLLQVKTAQVRLSAHIVCALPPVLSALLLLISPDYQEGMATPLGIACVLLALALDGAALLAMRYLMKGVL